MNKTRIEALSDGVFSIVMTLLIIEVKVPHLQGLTISNEELWHRLSDLWPLLRSYFISFLILGMYWTNHHAFFHMFTKQVNRLLNVVNIFFLMFLCFIPFSAHLMGQYPANEPAILIYGINIILIGMTLFIMLRMVINNPELVHEHVSKRLKTQAAIRLLLPPIFAVMGMLFAHVNFSLSYFLFAFPIIFNIIPGTLDVLEWLFIKQPLKILQKKSIA